MATVYSSEATGPLNTTPATFADGGVVGAPLRRIRGTYTMAGDASGTIIVVGKLPANARFAYGVLTASATLGTATIKIGTSSSDAAYMAAATFTTADTPTFFGKAAAVSGTAPTSADNIIITTATASLPGSGTLV